MSSSAPPQYRSGEKIPDIQRVQRILDDLGGRPEQKRQQVNIDDKAKDMFMEYSVELASSIIESANALSKHRGNQTIEPDDINLILGL